MSESGLYKLIMRSDKPAARSFQNWVSRVVMPSIRKDGLYIAGEEKVAKGGMSEDELILKATT
jgi:prophage antirepressor-like protein